MARAEPGPHPARVAVIRELFNALLIVVGICSASMGLKGLLLSSSFISHALTDVEGGVVKRTALH